jgi:hypothetical protein
MSNKVLNMVRDARIGDPTAKEVLRVVADQCNDAGTGVWSSFQYIAWCIERNRSTVIKKCNVLRDKGLLDRTKRSGTSNLWKIDLEKLEKIGVPYREPIEIEEELPETTSGETPPEELPETTPVVSTGDPSPKETKKKPKNKIEFPKGWENNVIFPDGEPCLDEHVCTHCWSAPKATKRKGIGYCTECKNIGKCARCGEDRVERHPKKRRDLCSKCGIIVDEMFDSRALLTFKKRSNHRLDWAQVEAMVETVGDEDRDLYTWGAWLDHWKASGWFMGKNAMGKILQGFKDNKTEFEGKAEVAQPVVPQYATQEDLEAWQNRRRKNG